MIIRKLNHTNKLLDKIKKNVTSIIFSQHFRLQNIINFNLNLLPKYWK